MKRTPRAIAATFFAVALTLSAGCAGGENDESSPTDEELAAQIEEAYVPAKSCWDSFRDPSCPDVLATVEESLKEPYEQLQKQGGREESVREIAQVQSTWREWLSKCMDDADAVQNSDFCLMERPSSASLDRAVELVRNGQ
ncbi:hypothetical protein SEA_BEEGEE_17 [Gordonia phage BeeGee]|nr:hypothetical protein SEA_BEEGEE_17 [Gordonia phage BeeGee]